MEYRDTQLDAWSGLQSSLDTRQDQVFQVIRSLGRAAGFEVARVLGLPLHCVSGRITELALMGQVEDSGKRTVNPGSGKKCVVWRVRE